MAFKKSKVVKISIVLLYILVPYAFLLRYCKNIIPVLISATFVGAALIIGQHFIQCDFPMLQY